MRTPPSANSTTAPKATRQNTRPATRLPARIAAFEVESGITADLAAANGHVAAIDAHLADTECYLCMGSEGPMTCANTRTLLVCGHACHDVCAIRARQVTYTAWRKTVDVLWNEDTELDIDDEDLEPPSEVVCGLKCGLCRFDFRTVPEGTVAGAGLCMPSFMLLGERERFKPSSQADLRAKGPAHARFVKGMVQQLSDAHKIVDKTYSVSNPIVVPRGYHNLCFQE